jgi:anti-sigma factor ChrR (cupin superfamily)
MMTHNRDEELELKATLHALGTLTQNEAQAFEDRRGRVNGESQPESFDDVVELLGLAATDAPPSAAVWEKLSQLIAAEPHCAEAISPETLTPAPPEETPQATSPALITIRKEEGEWVEFSEGIFIKPMFQNQQQGTSTYMVKMVPGARFELHRHHGAEECMMIEGDFHVDGKVLGPGDYHCALPGSIHERPYTVGGNLFLVVSSALYESLEERVS